MGLSGVGLEVEEAPALAEQLRKFPALKWLNLSLNPGLDCAFVSLIAKALSGKAVLLHRHIFVPTLSSYILHVLTVLQELHILLLSTSAALASRACPMTLCSICPDFKV